MGGIRLKSWKTLIFSGFVAASIGKLLLTANVNVPPGPAQSRTPDSRPDIVVILADDLDQTALDDAISYGFMPNLQRYLINEGMTFKNSFVSNSLCCPSRATLLTGQYPHNTGVQSNGGTNGGCSALKDRSTLATWLQSAGYRTGFVGKYLNLYGSGGASETRNCLNSRYIPPGWDDWQALVDPWTYFMYDYRINDNGKLVASENVATEYQTDVLSKRSVDFIRESAAQAAYRPMFLLVAPPIPHFSNVVPALCSTNFGVMFTIPPAPRDKGTAATIALPRNGSYNEADMSDKPAFYQQFQRLTATQDACLEKLYRDRIESVRALDDLVGTVAKALANLERLNDTVLIFTSDNGFLMGQHRLMHKGWPYEESIRVPLFIRAPGIPGAQSTSLFALNNDLAPTIADFARATPSIPVDGSSLRNVLQNPTTSNWRRRILSEWFNIGQNNSQTDPLTDFPVSLVGTNATQFLPPTYSMVRTSIQDPAAPDTSYIEYINSSREFYDLALDPYQLQSIHASSSPFRVSQMSTLSQWLAVLRNCSNGTCQSIERADTLPEQ